MQYSFAIKDENQKSFGLFVWFLFFFHLVAASIIAMNANNKDVVMELYLFFGLSLLISVLYLLFRKRKDALINFSLFLALLYVYFWFTNAGLIAAMIFVLIFVFVFMVRQKSTTVIFSEDGVLVKTVFCTVNHPWQKMENVILKDGLLTIDFKSNKLLQTEIGEAELNIDVSAFNLFCSEQLQNKN